MANGAGLMTTEHTILTDARFNPKLKIYFFLNGALGLAVTVVGILLLPLWVIFGTWWANRYFQSLKLQLTERNVVIKKGVWFRQELTIPIDKIQDISVREGPLLSAFGLLGLRIETAGQSNATTGKSEADLIGLIDARSVRDRILALRDAQTHQVSAPAHIASSQDLLRDIRDSLVRIEARLDKDKA